MSTSTLTLEDFARLFGTTVDDIPPDCRDITETEDFRYRKLDTGERGRVLASILKRLDSGNMWISGPDKRHIWEHGWSENLQEYKKTRDVSALTPKFVQREPILRLDRAYVQPLGPNFEFNFVDVYRR